MTSARSQRDSTARSALAGRIILVGHGAVGHCVLFLLCEKFGTAPGSVTVIDAKGPDSAAGRYQSAGMTYLTRRIDPENFASVLASAAKRGDLLLNLSTGIDSLKISDWCQKNGVLYVDTALDLWNKDGAEKDEADETEYALHQRIRRHAAARWEPGGPTSVFTHGANPGLVSHFVKTALVSVAKAMGLGAATPKSREDWARLARSTGTKVIHISERDTQRSRRNRPGEFANTWSVEGLIKEALMRGELGWGTHEAAMPPGGHVQRAGPRNAIYLDRAGGDISMRSWVPSCGPFTGLAIPHSECVTLSDYLTLREEGRPVYRPTVAFVYRPSDSALPGLRTIMRHHGRNGLRHRIMRDDIVEGRDELGVLLLGHGCKGWWCGSQLDIHQARRLAPGQNATVVQVAAGVIAAGFWALGNPNRGFCEPEDLPHDEILKVARPYLGPVVNEPVDWPPAADMAGPDGVWQLANFLSDETEKGQREPDGKLNGRRSRQWAGNPVL